jgi:drug/metabolite transporter (DMT)-like permease
LKDTALSRINWLKFITLGLIWGSSFLWIKIAVTEISPFTLVAFRVLFALVTLIIILLIGRVKVPLRSKWWVFLFLGAFNISIPFMLISWAEQHIPSAIAAILNGTPPLFTIIFATIFLSDDRFTWRKLAGLVIGFGGVLILMADHLGNGIASYTMGMAAMLVAAMSYGGSAIFARTFTKGMEPAAQAFGQQLSANLIMWPIALFGQAQFITPKLPLTWFALAFLGILCTGMATMIYYSLLHSVGPTRTMMTSYIFPVVGAILGLIFLREPFHWTMLLGTVVIISGVIIVNWQKPVKS